MSAETLAILIGSVCGTVVLVLFALLVLRPVVRTYWRGRDKVAAAFLSLYALAAMLGIGAAIGALVFYNWDRL